MCFAPQRRALFRHLNFQKWSEHGVFCTFWLGNVLRTTTACTFSTSQLPKAVRGWGVLYILTSKCASRHNGVQLFISHLASWLRTRRFSEPTFRPSGATNHWKTQCFATFLPFRAPGSSALLSSTLSLLSDPFHLCFSSVHTVGSLTSKLPSNIYIYIWDNPSHWLIFLKMVKTTNQIMLCSFLDKHGRGKRQKSSEAFGDSTKGLPSSHGSHVSLTKTLEWSSYWRMLKQHKTTAIEK